MISRSLGRGLFAAVLAQSLLVWNTGNVLQEKGDLVLDRQPRRFWEDLSLAVGYFKSGDLPVAYNAVQRWSDPSGDIYYKERGGVITNAAAKAGLTPWRFWRPVPPRTLNRIEFHLFPRFDDVGRPWLLGKAFHLVGGVAPYLFFWLGALLAFPILAWFAIETDASGRPVSAFLATVGFGLSAFVADALALTYSTAGFYVLGVLLLSAFAASAILGTPTRGALLWKSLLAGILLAFLVACRSGALLLLPGFVLVALVGVSRAGRPRRIMLWLLSAALLCIPTLAVQKDVSRLSNATFAKRGDGASPPQYHAIWFGVWTGLGDFDREKGYQWNDAAASAFMVQRGGSPLNPGSYDPRNEEILRDAILSDVLNDPAWYAGIVARRVGATVGQWNILPWKPLGGVSSRFDVHPVNYLASYYTLTGHVDVVRFYPAEAEVPLWLPMLATLGLVLMVRGREAWYVVCVAVGCLVLPVLITTAGAIEPMAFALIYIPGTAMAVEGLWRSRPKAASPVNPGPFPS